MMIVLKLTKKKWNFKVSLITWGFQKFWQNFRSFYYSKGKVENRIGILVPSSDSKYTNLPTSVFYTNIHDQSYVINWIYVKFVDYFVSKLLATSSFENLNNLVFIQKVNEGEKFMITDYSTFHSEKKYSLE